MDNTTETAQPTLEERVAALENELAAMAQLARCLAIGADNMREPDTEDVDQRFCFAVLRAAAAVCMEDSPRSLLLTYLARPSVRLPPKGVQQLDTLAAEPIGGNPPSAASC